ncbi:HAMP domain-containing protein [Ruegeria sediminis]|uniref:histidine kinase n=1 Tax=Ruegeria sediminis TaxID=2583820 RepID=A0ABY2X3P1_9RHOB|nr:ATP-binding protein [Ruegeria sediminis]TMV10009.1 HAMP domain-containing protein [Ruegeria sediminis]
MLRSLKAQTVAIVLVGLLVANGIGFSLYLRDRTDTLVLQEAYDIAERAAGVSRLLRNIPDAWNPEIVTASDSRVFRVWSSTAPPFENREPTEEEQELIAFFRTHVPRINDNEIRIWFRPKLPANFLLPNRPDTIEPADNTSEGSRWSLAIAVHHGGADWLNVYSQTTPSVGVLPRILVINLIIALLVQGAVAVWLVNRVTEPLQRMARAAARLGYDLHAAPMKEASPHEVRLAAQAFNSMQKQLIRQIENRTRMLAAISHDLRTPITQMRLRAELSPPSEDREKTLEALDEMNGIIGSFLDYARASSDHEKRVLLDLGSLVESICDDFSDSGASVSCVVREKVLFIGKRIALKRAISNVVQNAFTYGDTADVFVFSDAGHVVVQIDDNGPGIPLEDVDAVFQPFSRLANSGSHHGEGVGLGLSIARMIIEDHGGTIAVHNKTERGLRVSIVLPSPVPA